MGTIQRYLQFALVFVAIAASSSVTAEGDLADCHCGAVIDDGVVHTSSSNYSQLNDITDVAFGRNRYRQHRRANRGRRQPVEAPQHLLTNEQCQNFFVTDDYGNFIRDQNNQPILGPWGRDVYNLILGHARMYPQILQHPQTRVTRTSTYTPPPRGLPLCPNYANLNLDERILAYTMVVTALVAAESDCQPRVENFIGAVGLGQVESQPRRQANRYPDCRGSAASLKNPIKNLKCVVGELLLNEMPDNGETAYDLRTDAGLAENTQWQPMHRYDKGNQKFLTLVRNFPLCQLQKPETETAEAPN
jgi:hypothetical protein